MDDKTDDIKKLLDRWMQDLITPEEKQELIGLLQKTSLAADVIPALEKIWDDQSWQPVFSHEETTAIVDRIIFEHPSTEEVDTIAVAAPVHFLRRWGWAAASVLLIILAGAYVLINRKPDAAIASRESVGIQPGQSGAILTLADGSTLVLENGQNKVIALQGGTTAKIVNGTLSYEGRGAEVFYNTMSTPKGRQFHLIMPDGTEVWLNSASSIRYPTVFSGKQRRVEIMGEAYFQVAKNKEMPFLLNVNNRAQIMVLGTAFNVNAYDNEAAISTTLIEGSVQVKAGAGIGEKEISSGRNAGKIPVVTLKAGQQALVHTGNNPPSKQIDIIHHADIEKVLAWKNGVFDFNDITFEEAMRQLERWYAIEVIYGKDVPKRIELTGKITRDVTLDGLLNALREIGIKCRLEKRKLFIQ